jgi:hypothetical protein
VAATSRWGIGKRYSTANSSPTTLGLGHLEVELWRESAIG